MAYDEDAIHVVGLECQSAQFGPERLDIKLGYLHSRFTGQSVSDCETLFGGQSPISNGPNLDRILQAPIS